MRFWWAVVIRVMMVAGFALGMPRIVIATEIVERQVVAAIRIAGKKTLAICKCF